jgi:predicted Co/Zn/Cd cation transporter (cation efflux family)
MEGVYSVHVQAQNKHSRRCDGPSPCLRPLALLISAKAGLYILYYWLADRIEEVPMEGKDIVYGIGIVLTFALVVWNLVINYRNTRRANFINTVTAQRVKWIEQLRQDISAYAGLTHTWCLSGLEGKPEEGEILKEIDRLRRVIRLRLNPSGDVRQTDRTTR